MSDSIAPRDVAVVLKILTEQMPQSAPPPRAVPRLVDGPN